MVEAVQTVETDLTCWLCNRSYRLRLHLLYANSILGTPHFWCRECCDPYRLKRMLKKVLADANKPGPVHKMNADEMAAIQKILTGFDGSQTSARPFSRRERYEDFTGDEQESDGEVLDVAAD